MTNPTLPKDAIQIIDRGEKYWHDSDTSRWSFAEIAHIVVGKYIPYASEVLATRIGLDVSSVQGYAKAYKLKVALKEIGHVAPLPNIFISHYIVCGKAFFARDSQWTLQQIDELLRTANEWRKSVKWLRSKIGNVSEEDSYLNSISKTIADLEAHTIHAPYYGVPEYKAVIAARIATVLVKVLRWIQNGSDDVSAESIEREVDAFVEIADRLFPEREYIHE